MQHPTASAAEATEALGWATEALASARAAFDGSPEANRAVERARFAHGKALNRHDSAGRAYDRACDRDRTAERRAFGRQPAFA